MSLPTFFWLFAKGSQDSFLPAAFVGRRPQMWDLFTMILPLICILHLRWIQAFHGFPQFSIVHILQLHSQLQSTATNQGVGTSAGQMARTRRGTRLRKKIWNIWTKLNKYEQGMKRIEQIWKVHICVDCTPAVLLWNTLLIPTALLGWFSWAWGVNKFNSLPSPAI